LYNRNRGVIHPGKGGIRVMQDYNFETISEVYLSERRSASR
jgi:hypothetical protein